MKIFSLGMLLVNILFCNVVNAQALDSIYGIITDENKQPLDGAEIIWGTDGIKTKADGTFKIKVSKTSHSQNITFSKLGYDMQSVNFSPKNFKNNPITIQLHDKGQPKDAYRISKVNIEAEVLSIMKEKWGTDFKHVVYPKQYLNNVIILNPGDSIQKAINSIHSKGGGVVYLQEGTYVLERSLNLMSKVSLVGAGRTKTIIKQGASVNKIALTIGSSKVTDVVLKDFSLQGHDTASASGVSFGGKDDNRHERWMLQNITITGFGSHGLGISRINNVIMDNCEFQHNGWAGSLHHNVYLMRIQGVLQSDCDMSYPTMGKSNKYTSTSHVLAQRCKLEVGKTNGIQVDAVQSAYHFFHKYNLSKFKRVAMWFPCEDYYNKFNYTENSEYAPQHVILNRCEIVDNTWGAMWRVVNNSYVINSVFDNKKIDMGLLKCDVKMEDSTFKTGNEMFTNVKQWPKDVRILW
ncbi:pectin lyase fold protein [Formosa agariphila KMM 3901]|uniref:Pectin lyase fold protein n=1 Tax=Formosa agariphila (strain DSM 15362 / KCTC 12365 / LMG 23005 / KMM 3901 / M-2Alg 35-1) TaxID=1347342 RepID=T2KIU2_FORAG|nr:glycosyl hydrolase family 28-related protein [Formosa agariphila]CDF78725.1 pectin lyase fold protein [Formosa agariphila KMM 3901]